MIKLLISAEVDREVSRRLIEIAKEVAVSFNNVSIGAGAFNDKIEIRYVPIVMPNGGHGRYPPRMKYYPKENALDLGPTLSHETFRSGTSDEAIREYCRGLKLAREMLPEQCWPEFDSRISSVEKELGLFEP